MAVVVCLALGLLALAASAVFALDLGRIAEMGVEWHLSWRRDVGRRVQWLKPGDLSDRALRRAVLVIRVGFALVFLLFAAALIAAGVARLS